MNPEIFKNNVSGHNVAKRQPEPEPFSPGSEISPVPAAELTLHEDLDETADECTPEALRFRAQSLLTRLTEDQRKLLLEWLHKYTVPQVVRLVAALPPRGFGIRTHKTTLRRLKGMLRSNSAAIEFDTSSAAAEDLNFTIRQNSPEFGPTIADLLLQKAFDQASHPSNLYDLKDLINSAIKLRELELKVERLQLLRQRQALALRRNRLRVEITSEREKANAPG